MNIVRTLEHDVEDTVKEIMRLAIQYSDDVADYATINVRDFFDFVKNIRYVKDPVNKEFIKRPKYTIQYDEGDCDDKTVVCLAYFWYNNIPSGVSIVSKNKTYYHHVFPFIILKGKKIDFDATYPTNKLGQKKQWLLRKDYIFIK